MRIGIFSPTLNVFGGGEFVAIAIANTLAQNGHQVVLFSNKKVNALAVRDFLGEKLRPSIRTVKQPAIFSPRGLGDFYQSIFHSYTANLKCELLIDTYTNCLLPWTSISYIHFPFYNHYSFSKKFPYLASPHLIGIGTLPYVLIEKNLTSYSDKLILANSQYTAQELRRFSGKKANVLYPPFPSKTLESNIKEDNKQKLVVTTCRFDEKKQLEKIPIIASRTQSSIKFALIGRVCNKKTFFSLKEEVKRLNLSDRVKFYPDASAAEKIELLKKASVYLHTMVGEHFGISIVEAMASGCIPIVHNSGGTTEFVPVNYRYETIQEAANMIDNVIESWSFEKAVNIKEIANNFSLTNFSSRFMYLFNKFLS